MVAAAPESGNARGVAFMYFDGEAFTVHIEPACDPGAGGEMWAEHPWTQTDPKLLTYHHCPRCGARRLVIPAALREVRPRPAPERLWAGFDLDGNPIPL